MKKIYVAGHRGLVGSSLVRRLRAEGLDDLITPTRAELDLRDQASVDAFFAAEHPEYVFLAAARVGGIMANAKQPADFLYDNLAIQTNAIHSAWRHGVKKLLFFATSAAYPRQAAQPLREEYLLTGPMEPSNEAYSIAKIAGVKLCQAYRKQHGFNAISAMPCNIYGPGDKFDAENANVLGALLRRFVEAKESGAPEVVVWGSGTPRREFLHVEDLASAALFLMRHYDGEVAINVGASEDVTIRELAETIARVTGYTGRVVFDSSKPDGVPRKLLDTGRLSALGWKPSIPLEEGIAETYRWFMTTRPKA